jgi:hypothetical protein
VARRRAVGEGKAEEGEGENADGEADEDHGTTRLFKAVDVWPEKLMCGQSSMPGFQNF